MKKTKWLTIGIALTLALVMIWAVPTFAQGRGNRGQWGPGQGRGQAWGCPGGGYGQGGGYGPAGVCPGYPGYRNSRGYYGNNPQANAGRQGNRGGGRNTQPNTQPSTPPATK